MKIKSFKYAKSEKSITDRVVAVLSEPTTNMFGIDITELSDEQSAAFAAAFDTLQKDYYQRIEYLMKDYDIGTMYRNFNPEKMSDIEVEDI